MTEWFRDVGRWCVAILSAWYGWLPSSALAALIAYGQALDWWKPNRRWYALLLLGGGVVSIFEAWRKEHRKVRDAAPCFVMEILGAYASLNIGNTLVLLAVRITNQGADSAITDWDIHYKSIDLDQRVRMVLVNQPVRLPIGNSVFVFDPAHAINLRATEVIPRGGFIVGRLPVLIPGDRTKEIPRGDGEFIITIWDYLKTPYSQAWRGTGESEVAVYVTGEPIAQGQIGENFSHDSVMASRALLPANGPRKKKKRRQR